MKKPQSYVMMKMLVMETLRCADFIPSPVVNTSSVLLQALFCKASCHPTDEETLTFQKSASPKFRLEPYADVSILDHSPGVVIKGYC